MNTIHLKALAKINLGLDVTGQREDGYHLVRMIMQTVELYDQVTIEKSAQTGIILETNLKFLPVDQHNIAYKAAALLMQQCPQITGVVIRIHKCIPVAAGMAGGSTDAAAVLYGMNRLFQLGFSMKQLMEFGLILGADVPYCLMRGTALAEGIGEDLKRIPDMPDCSIIIAKPPVSVSTRTVYEKLDSMTELKHPDIDALLKDLQEKNLHNLADHMGNILEEVTIPLHPEIAQIKALMKEQGAMNAMMSGSGPTVFGLYADKEKAELAREKIWQSGLARQVYVTGVYNIGTKGNQKKK